MPSRPLDVLMYENADRYAQDGTARWEPFAYGACLSVDISWNPRILEHTPGYENGILSMSNGRGHNDGGEDRDGLGLGLDDEVDAQVD